MNHASTRIAIGISGWFALAIVSCAPMARPHTPSRAPIPRADERVAPPTTPVSRGPASPPATAAQPPRFSVTTRVGIAFRGVDFDSRHHRLSVVDQPHGPGSRFPDAAAVGRSTGAWAVINGGFYTPEGEPWGAVVSEGVASGTWNAASSLGSALWQEDRAGRSMLVRRSATSRGQASRMQNLLQAGPLLLEQGAPVRGLDDQKHSARTVLLWDGGHRWWLGLSTPTTLARLAHTLAQQPPTAWSPIMALNLDGGRSSELWVARSVSDPEIHHRPPWNRAVRNFLALVPRG
jgi:hypothetical protein